MRELKTTLESVVISLQEQSIKKDESDNLLHAIHSKVDMQSQRLVRLEMDVKDVKDTIKQVLSNRDATEALTTRKASGQDKEHQSASSDLLSLKAETVGSFQTLGDEVKCLMREQTQLLGNVGNICEKYSTEIKTRVDTAEREISQMSSEVKQTVKQMEGLDKSISSIENSTNGFCSTLESIQDQFENFLSKDEMKLSLQELKDASVRQHEVLNQVVTKNLKTAIENVTKSKQRSNQQQLTKVEFDQKMNELSQMTREKLDHARKESVDDVKKELTDMKDSAGYDILKEMITQQTWNLLNQITAESKITREYVQNCRSVRKKYICDFFVYNFKDVLNSNSDIYSQLWYIDQWKRHVKCSAHVVGRVLKLWLVEGTNSCVQGLDRETGPYLQVRVSLVKDGRENCVVGSEELGPADAWENSECDGWGYTVGEMIAQVSFDEIISQNWMDDEKKVLFRFEITVQ